MRYVLLIAWREYIEAAKAKGFWLGIFLMPTILFFSIQVPVWLQQKAAPIRHFVIVDRSGEFANLLEARFERDYQQSVYDALKDYVSKNSVPSPAGGASDATAGALPKTLDTFIESGGQDHVLEQMRPRLKAGSPAFKAPRRLLQSVPLPQGVRADAELSFLAQQLRPYLRGEKKIEQNGQWFELSAAILIPRHIQDQIVRPQTGSGRPAVGESIQDWSLNASETQLRDEAERAINGEIRRREYLARGIDRGVIQQIEQTYIPIASLNPRKEAGKEAVNKADIIQQWAPSAFVYLLWLAIFVIMQMLLHNTIEEKSNRIIEVLLSSVTPGELMMGKLFGIAATGLTMIGAWMVALFGILSWKSGGASEISGQMLAVLKGSNLIPLFSIYFLLGYFMYAALILSVGSVCNTLKDAQSYMSVMTMIMMVPVLTMTYIPRDPNGTLARVLSWIPLYTPFTMMNRANASPPMVDLIGTLVLLLFSTGLALWMAGKIFRIGILRTGQPPKLIEMLRWVKM